MGRTEFHRRLASQAVMPASNSALLRAMNTLASVSRPWWSRRDTHWANRFQWPGGVSEPGGSSQYSAMTFWVSVRPALYVSCWSTSLRKASLGLPFKTVTAGPWSGRNWSAEVSAKGATLPQWG
jgi:hypothetical protein